MCNGGQSLLLAADFARKVWRRHYTPSKFFRVVVVVVDLVVPDVHSVIGAGASADTGKWHHIGV